MAEGSLKPGGKALGSLAAAIALILAAVFSVEGGYVDHRDDPGGATNHGITEQTAREDSYKGDMRDLTREQAAQILDRKYVRKPGFDGVVLRSVALGQEVVDTGVNMGPHRPSCYLQTALNALNRKQADYPDVTVDCLVGPATLAAFDGLARKRGNRQACELLIKLVDAQQGAEYLRLSYGNGWGESFMVGWAKDRLGNVPLARCAAGGVQ